MVVDIITIFPEMFAAPMSASIIGNARESGTLELRIHDLREWTADRHRTVDDSPYGGGPGMVMKPEPLFAAIRDVRAAGPGTGTVIVLSPGGDRFTQAAAVDLATHERLILVCGRYEGIDERVLTCADMSLSIGDYVLTGGELPAMVLIDTVTRLLPGVLGHDESVVDESFSEGLLEYPQYTRPPEFEGLTVPEVLLSGDHGRIAAYRRAEAIRKTARVRPELLAGVRLTEDEQRIADDARREISS